MHAAGTELQLDARSLGGAAVVAAARGSRRRWCACLARLARRASTLLLLRCSASAQAAAIPITAAATSAAAAAAAACLQEQVFQLLLLSTRHSRWCPVQPPAAAHAAPAPAAPPAALGWGRLRYSSAARLLRQRLLPLLLTGLHRCAAVTALVATNRVDVQLHHTSIHVETACGKGGQVGLQMHAHVLRCTEDSCISGRHAPQQALQGPVMPSSRLLSCTRSRPCPHPATIHASLSRSNVWRSPAAVSAACSFGTGSCGEGRLVRNESSHKNGGLASPVVGGVRRTWRPACTPSSGGESLGDIAEYFAAVEAQLQDAKEDAGAGGGQIGNGRQARQAGPAVLKLVLTKPSAARRTSNTCTRTMLAIAALLPRFGVQAAARRAGRRHRPTFSPPPPLPPPLQPTVAAAVPPPSPPMCQQPPCPLYTLMLRLLANAPILRCDGSSEVQPPLGAPSSVGTCGCEDGWVSVGFPIGGAVGGCWVVGSAPQVCEARRCHSCVEPSCGGSGSAKQPHVTRPACLRLFCDSQIWHGSADDWWERVRQKHEKNCTLMGTGRGDERMADKCRWSAAAAGSEWNWRAVARRGAPKTGHSCVLRSVQQGNAGGGQVGGEGSMRRAGQRAAA